MAPGKELGEIMSSEKVSNQACIRDNYVGEKQNHHQTSFRTVAKIVRVPEFARLNATEKPT